MRVLLAFLLFGAAIGSTLNGTEIASPTRSTLLGEQEFSITAPVSYVETDKLCAGLPAGSQTGNIVAAGGNVPGCNMETQAANAKAAGAVGQIFVIPDYMRPGRYVFSSDAGGDATAIPVVEMCNGPDMFFAEGGHPTGFTLAPTANSYKPVKEGMLWFVCWRVFMGPWNGICIVMAAKNLMAQMDKDGGFNMWRCAHSGLLLEGVSCFLRFCFLMIDPFFSTGRFPIWLGQRMIMISSPFGFTTTLLVAFAWMDAVKAMGSSKNSSNKARWFLITAVIAIWVMEFASANLRARNMPLGTTVRNNAFLVIFFNLVCAVFFFCTGCKVVGKLKGQKGSNDGGAGGWKKKFIQKMSKWLAISAVGMLLLVAGMLVAGPGKKLYWTPMGQIIMWMLSYSGMTLTSHSQIIAFGVSGGGNKKAGAGQTDTEVSSGGSSASDSHTN